MIGIIGGSGLYDIEGVNLREERQIMTPYGIPSERSLIEDLLPGHAQAGNLSLLKSTRPDGVDEGGPSRDRPQSHYMCN